MRGLWNGVLLFLVGAVLLSFFSTVQKMMGGYPIIFKAYLVPVLVGGSFGLIIVMWQLKLKQNEEKMARLNLVLRAIRNVNQLLVKEKDRTRLLQGVCNNLVENRGYYNAWTALIDEAGGLVATAEKGLGKKFPPLVERLKRGELTDCGRSALSQQGVVVTEDPASTCTDCPLSAGYSGRGAMTIRLEYGGKTYGMLSVSIPKCLVLDEEEKALFQEVAGDIAFALYSLELEEDQKRAKDALRESENRYRAIFETTGTATIIIEEDTTISMANMEFEELSGYSREEVEGNKSLTDFVGNREDLEKMKAYHETRRIDPGAAPRNYEFKFVDKKGTVKEIFTAVGVIPGTRKRVGSFLDVTERKRGEEALRESEQRFRHLVENSLTGIVIIQDDQVIYKNPEQERLSQPFSRSSMPLNFENVHPDDVEEVKQNYQDLVSGKERRVDMDFKFYPQGKTGSKSDLKCVHCHANLIEFRGKEAVLVNLMDVTETKELEHLVIIQDKMSSLGRVAAGIAHEIRNPLSGINVYLNTLEKIYKRGQHIEKSAEIIRQMQSASGKIESIIRKVMDFSKPSEPKFVVTDINKPIEEAINLSSVMLRKMGVTIETSLEEDLPPCSADTHMIEQVILNIIINASEAMKYLDIDKKIEVNSSLENNRILIRISDSGLGVPSNIKEKIFEPFYTTKSDSTGIGLSLSHRIITDHGGFLNVSTSKWGGAEFLIEIPLEKETKD